eukprot:11502005-Alexandrium_andersonii.AAC.1
MDREPAVMSPEGQREFEHVLKLVGIHARAAGVHLRPKFHMLPHVGEQSAAVGNMKFACSLEDE